MKKIITTFISVLIILTLIGCKQQEEFVFDKCTVVTMNVGATKEFNKHYDLDIQHPAIVLCSHEWRDRNDTWVFEGGYILDDVPLTEAFCFIDKNNQKFSEGKHLNSFICNE